jgi:hypothetical protein
MFLLFLLCVWHNKAPDRLMRVEVFCPRHIILMLDKRDKNYKALRPPRLTGGYAYTKVNQ